MPDGIAAVVVFFCIVVIAAGFVTIKYMPSGKVIKPPTGIGR